ncbi:condensation domain-containing protein [Streptomyces sp. NPDC101110]|uniref:condensation domain-containing protein n=1 Tax=Streptomyces sp. NPDC101110 TaxID=3366104 RepID=UPI003811784E
MSIADVRTVPFSGERGSGVQPLTWGQRWIWRAVAAQAPSYAHFGAPFRVDIPSGCDMDGVLSSLSALLRRHETLRTRYFVDEHGKPRQVIAEQGDLRVEVHDCAENDVAVAVRQAEKDLARLPFTIPELAVRVAVITADGVPAKVTLIVFHMAIDAWGMHRVTEELHQRLRSCADGAELPALQEISHPSDRARDEQSHAGQRRSQAALKRWRREIDTFPRVALPALADAAEPVRFHEHTLYSKALLLASPALARHLGTNIGSVILAHALRLLGKLSGNPRCGFLMFSHNRFLERDLHYSGTLVQSVPVGVDVTTSSLRELVKSCHQSVLRSVMGCECDPDEVDALLEDYSAETGYEADLSCAFNLFFPEFGQEGDQAAQSCAEVEPEARRSARGSRFGPVKEFEWDDMKFYLGAYIEDGEFVLSLRADTALLPSSQIARFLTDVESLVLDSLTDASLT